MNENTMVSYNQTTDSIDLNGTTMSWDYWHTYPEFERWYPCPVYYGTTRYEDTYKKAFNIAKLLLKKNLLSSRKLKDFIGLVEEIAKEL